MAERRIYHGDGRHVAITTTESGTIADVTTRDKAGHLRYPPGSVAWYLTRGRRG